MLRMGWAVPPMFPPRFHSFSNSLELFLLLGRKILPHFGDGLIEDRFRFASVLPAKGMELFRGADGDLFDLLSLLL